jgi:STE24 endopeptidase
MKAAVAAGVFVFVALFVATTYVPSPEAQAEARAYGFSSEEIERGLEYSLERKLISWGAIAAWLGFLTAAVVLGWGRRAADVVQRLTRGRWLLSVLLVGAAVFAVQVLVALGFGLVRLEQQRAWDMTRLSVGAWLEDFGKGQAVAAGMGVVVIVGLYLLLRYFPRTWWALAAAGGTLLGILYAILLPVLIDPLFHTFHPLEDPALNQSVRALAEKAGVPVREVLVMDASRRGSHTNAYFTGFGPTRRIVLYDTLLQDHSRAEIESILAHEIGHWQHHHIVKGIALAAVGSFLGLFVLAQILRWAVGRRPLRLTSVADPAGLPLVLLLVELGTWAALPVQNAVSRHFERQADTTSLDLAGDPDVFISAEEKMARKNISNVAPNPLSVWLFATHPPVLERIDMAKEWKREHSR